MLNSDQIRKIAEIIREHSAAMMYLFTGVAPNEISLRKLVDAGVIDSADSLDVMKDAYVYGILATYPELAKESVPEILDRIKAIPLSEIERNAVKWLSESAANYCQGLGNRFDVAAGRIVHDAAREAMLLRVIKETMASEAAKRETRSRVVTALRDATKDMQRDWQRVVNTELHQAMTTGTAAAISREFGKGATIIVRPYPDACDLCKDAYLDRSGVPRIFRLTEVSAKNNVGRKTAELRKAPGLPPLHPHCFCQISYFDEKVHEFDKEGRIVLKEK
ncbi:MAG: hypothetical protein JW836_11230 [Deltaproteobacteria bacterium]|nr:hypothetical protein [Deltaproteobacteria bacterium]